MEIQDLVLIVFSSRRNDYYAKTLMNNVCCSGRKFFVGIGIGDVDIKEADDWEYRKFEDSFTGLRELRKFSESLGNFKLFTPNLTHRAIFVIGGRATSVGYFQNGMARKFLARRVERGQVALGLMTTLRNLVTGMLDAVVIGDWRLLIPRNCRYWLEMSGYLYRLHRFSNRIELVQIGTTQFFPEPTMPLPVKTLAVGKGIAEGLDSVGTVPVSKILFCPGKIWVDEWSQLGWPISSITSGYLAILRLIIKATCCRTVVCSLHPSCSGPLWVNFFTNIQIGLAKQAVVSKGSFDEELNSKCVVVTDVSSCAEIAQLRHIRTIICEDWIL